MLQRQQLPDALARNMAQLGLKRRSRPMGTLQELLAKEPGAGWRPSFRGHETDWPQNRKHLPELCDCK
jgi:hypothetical protein